MRFYAAPTPIGTGQGNSWANAGDLQTMINNAIAASSPGGDEVWALGDNNRFGVTGPYNLAGSPLNITGNTAPLSVYGGFRGRERSLCDRRANIICNDTNFPDYFQHPSILDGGNANSVIDMQQANVCRIDGFIIRNGSATTAATGFEGGGVRVRGNRNIWLENLVIMDNEARNIGGGIYMHGFSTMIKNSIFLNNHATNGGGLFMNDGNNTLLVNLLFNENQAAMHGTTGNGNAIYINGGHFNVKIINNTISGNTIGSSDVYCTSPSVGIYNSIIYPDSLVAAGNANVVVDYCCLGTTPISIPPNANITFPVPPNLPIGTNPNFAPIVPPFTWNFHLQPGSPCIDSGNTERIFPFSATDLEGKPRFINSVNPPPFPFIQIDMGAFEWQ